MDSENYDGAVSKLATVIFEEYSNASPIITKHVTSDDNKKSCISGYLNILIWKPQKYFYLFKQDIINCGQLESFKNFATGKLG